MSTNLPQIFVSHSQYDTDIRRSFNEIFAISGVIPKYMEFETIKPPAWTEIKEQIKKSLAVFLLLGPNIRRTCFTANWVAFEVGVSCAFGKDVWVFEPTGLNSDFPIPYLTDYVIYDLQVRENFDYIRGIIEGYRRPSYTLSFEDERTKRGIPKGKPIICDYGNCGSVYSLHTEVTNFYCPSCRQQLSFTISSK